MSGFAFVVAETQMVIKRREYQNCILKNDNLKEKVIFSTPDMHMISVYNHDGFIDYYKNPLRTNDKKLDFSMFEIQA